LGGFESEQLAYFGLEPVAGLKWNRWYVLTGYALDLDRRLYHTYFSALLIFSSLLQLVGTNAEVLLQLIVACSTNTLEFLFILGLFLSQQPSQFSNCPTNASNCAASQQHSLMLPPLNPGESQTPNSPAPLTQ
jgi:hypothetical protein